MAVALAIVILAGNQVGAVTGDQLERGREVVKEAKTDPDLPKVDLGACLRQKERENKMTALSLCQELVEDCITKCMAKHGRDYGGRIGCNSVCQQ
jgi:hypothetical protein